MQEIARWKQLEQMTTKIPSFKIKMTRYLFVTVTWQVSIRPHRNEFVYAQFIFKDTSIEPPFMSVFKGTSLCHFKAGFCQIYEFLLKLPFCSCAFLFFPTNVRAFEMIGLFQIFWPICRTRENYEISGFFCRASNRLENVMYDHDFDIHTKFKDASA